MIGITERGDAALQLDWQDWVDAKKPAILITKNPEKLLRHISSRDNIIVHCTITGYGGTAIEPNVPPPERTIEAYDNMIDMLGKERVVLRVDPIICTTKGIRTAIQMVKQHRNTRVRISFLDCYAHVIQRFAQAGLPIPSDSFHFPLERRTATYEILQEITPIQICGEPGMPCIGCVSEIDCNVLGVKPVSYTGHQRKYCRCLAMKKELLSIDILPSLRFAIGKGFPRMAINALIG